MVNLGSITPNNLKLEMRGKAWHIARSAPQCRPQAGSSKT